MANKKRSKKRPGKRPGGGLVARARQSVNDKAKDTPHVALAKLAAEPPGIAGCEPGRNRHKAWDHSPPPAGADRSPIPFQGFSAHPEDLVPDGWLDESPLAGVPPDPFGMAPDQCAILRGRVARWVAEGIRVVHEADTADTAEHNVVFEWGDSEVRTHGTAVESAVAVLTLAEHDISDCGYTLLAAPREPTPGLIPDMPVACNRKHLRLMCIHDNCDSADTDLVDIEADWDWPSAAAAVESWVEIL